MKHAQIILYNQLRQEYCNPSLDTFCYIHHTGNVTFQWESLNFNTHSKIIDYAGGKELIHHLREQGKNAHFLTAKSFLKGILQLAKQHDITHFFLIKPCENYVYENFLIIQRQLQAEWIQLDFWEDNMSFFLSHAAFQEQYQKPPIMEFFYRFMRKKENILIDESGKPEWGKRNFDSENRKFDKKHTQSWQFHLEKNIYIQEAEAFYNFEVRFLQPSNSKEAESLLKYFIENHLDTFGRLEDAMYQDDPYVHHSLLSTSINFWFLSPKEVVKQIHQASTAINNKEWFIRQVLGWREYMYHFFMFYKGDIYSNNFLEHHKSLPAHFWKTWISSKMNCLDTSIKQVQKENNSHHIQRLMIIGNYALLTGRNPHELNKWFFEYYTDAFEWVVTPNVLWMSQYADGWKLATKPYVSSANYINKMSDYCKNCIYNPKEKYTDTSCPYNYLYWNFVDDQKEVFQKGRQQFVLKNLEKIDIQKIKTLKASFLKQEK